MCEEFYMLVFRGSASNRNSSSDSFYKLVNSSVEDQKYLVFATTECLILNSSANNRRVYFLFLNKLLEMLLITGVYLHH